MSHINAMNDPTCVSILMNMLVANGHSDRACSIGAIAISMGRWDITNVDLEFFKNYLEALKAENKLHECSSLFEKSSLTFNQSMFDGCISIVRYLLGLNIPEQAEYFIALLWKYQLLPDKKYMEQIYEPLLSHYLVHKEYFSARKLMNDIVARKFSVPEDFILRYFEATSPVSNLSLPFFKE